MLQRTINRVGGLSYRQRQLRAAFSNGQQLRRAGGSSSSVSSVVMHAHPVARVPGFEKVSLEPESLPPVSVVSDSPAGWKGGLLAVAVTTDDLHTTDGCTGWAELCWGHPPG